MHAQPLDEARIADPRTPITLLLDDPTPIAHVYQCHNGPGTTRDGRWLLEEIPNGFVERFADVVERWGMRGKFSIVPGMGGLGELKTGIDGGRLEEIRQWLDIARKRLAPHMDFSPEMITHHLAVNLATGGYLDVDEATWAETQTEEALTPYITRALQMLRDVDIDATGVTSPWDFGIKTEVHYRRAIIAAQKAVYGRDRCWYFLHTGDPNARPEVVVDEPPSVLVSIPATAGDSFWQTIDSPETSHDYVSRVASECLSEDAAAGQLAALLANGGCCILLTHWQSLFSNGLETGLAALDETGRRVQERLSDRVVWCSASEIMERTIRASGRMPA